MITLLTGLPGNGKGVYGLDFWKTKAENENRTVYYHNINDCKIPGWIELDDPKDWFKVPPGSMVLLDECQHTFRSRAAGSTVPPHVAHLETHRHNGLDLLLITQHPMIIDQNVRRLVGQHLHIVRRFGMQSAVVHEWTSVVPEPGRNRKDSIKRTYNYNKEVYTWYKSAEVHTVKRNIPKRIFALGGIIVAVPLLAYAAWHFLNPQRAHDRIAGHTDKPGEVQLQQRQAAAPKLTWYEEQMPRVTALPATAPKYDDVTKPTRAPRPAACVLMHGNCRCYTQQATRLQTDDATCRQIVENGYFIDYDDKPVPADNPVVPPQAQQQNELQPVALRDFPQGEPVAPGSVDLAPEAQQRSPAKVARDRMSESSHAFKYPGGAG